MSLEARPLGDQRETVNCPHCDRSRPAGPGVYVCKGCGGWFTIHQVSDP